MVSAREPLEATTNWDNWSTSCHQLVCAARGVGVRRITANAFGSRKPARRDNQLGQLVDIALLQRRGFCPASVARLTAHPNSAYNPGNPPTFFDPRAGDLRARHLSACNT